MEITRKHVMLNWAYWCNPVDIEFPEETIELQNCFLMDGKRIHLVLSNKSMIFREDDLTEVSRTEIKTLDPFCQSIDCFRDDLSQQGFLLSV